MTTPQTHNEHPDQSALLESRLDSLLTEAGDLIDQLQAVGAEQRHAVESGQVQQIVEVVAKREPIVQSMIRIGEELGAFIENPTTKETIPDRILNGALLRIAGYEHAMKRLREQDAKDQVLMEQARDKLAAQLAGMGSGQSALRAYSTRSVKPNPIMQDRKG
jgi:flagellar biosynthesis/type III secretory pathway chaperone